MSLGRLFRRRRSLPFAEFGWEPREFVLPRDGRIEFAQWQHPFDRPAELTQAAVDALRRFVSAGDFVIDVGAHTGDTAVPLALAAGRAGLVLALEPNPHVFTVLAANAALNREKLQIDARCFAATEEVGSFVFHYSDASYCNGGFKSQQRSAWYRRKHPLVVEGRNLRDVLDTEFAHWLPKLSYVKVDAEGYDRAILQSLLPILREYRPVIRTEVFRKLRAGERFALFDLLAGEGYRLHLYQNDGDSQGQPLVRTDMTREKHFDILAVPRHAASRYRLAA
jgi:FkbM family methyltransferase